MEITIPVVVDVRVEVDVIEGWRCPECDEVSSDDDVDQENRVYECNECGRFTREESANYNHQCPQCNRFGAKVANFNCPKCDNNMDDMEPVEAVECGECDEIVAADEIESHWEHNHGDREVPSAWSLIDLA